MEKVVVIGAGVIGVSTTLDLLLNNYKVHIVDNKQLVIDQVRNKLSDHLKMVKLFKAEYRSVDAAVLSDSLTSSINLQSEENVKLIIENVTENIEIKKEVYQKINTAFNKDVIVAANTSCISITKLGGMINNPARLIGMHFMNPVPLKKIVEVIKGVHTSEETIHEVKVFSKSLKKNTVIINDSVGFVSNRLSHLLMNEAAFLVYENVASPREIDMIIKMGFEHKMGPLETADLIGIDTVVNSLEVLYNEYQDSKFKVCPLLKKMCNAGYLGKKSNKGFYEY